MSSSPHIDNKKQDILVLWRGPTQGLESTLTGVNSYLFVNDTEIYKFKAKDSEIVAIPLCLGNISKDWSADNTKRTGFTGYVYDFRTDYDPIANDDIKDIHKYLKEKII